MDPEDIAKHNGGPVDILERSSSCPICMDTLQLNEEVNVLGCGHPCGIYPKIKINKCFTVQIK